MGEGEIADVRGFSSIHIHTYEFPLTAFSPLQKRASGLHYSMAEKMSK